MGLDRFRYHLDRIRWENYQGEPHEVGVTWDTNEPGDQQWVLYDTFHDGMIIGQFNNDPDEFIPDGDIWIIDNDTTRDDGWEQT